MMIRERLFIFWSNGYVGWSETDSKFVRCPCGAEAALIYDRFGYCYEKIECGQCILTAEAEIWEGKIDTGDVDD